MRQFDQVVAEREQRSFSGITRITQEHIDTFRAELLRDDKAPDTIAKYLNAVTRLHAFLGAEGGGELTQENLLAFRSRLLTEEHLKPQTVNVLFSGIRCFLTFLGRIDLHVKALRIQHSPFREEERELTRAEYERLVQAAARRGNERLVLILETLCAAGIRVSELRFFTVEAVKAGRIQISLKGKNRTILMPADLRRALLSYADRKEIRSGVIFRTRSGKPLHRSNIAHEMKKLSEEAGVDPRKVFPHNLRHLFAREFHAACPNLALLADILGHSRIETTRIYVATSAVEHEKILGSLHLCLPRAA